MNIISKFIQKTSSIPKIYNNFGFDGLLFSILRNIGFKIKYQSIIDKKKENLEKKIIIKTHKTIIDGPYRNTTLNCNSNWHGYDWSSKLLGCYEQQVQDKIVNIKKTYKLKNIINFGGGDGYHIIGLVKNNFFEKGLVFEIDEKSKKFLSENIDLNNLNSKISVETQANFKTIEKYFDKNEMNESLYLIDIEGEEYNLINKKNLKYYSKSILIIEDHHFLINDKSKKKEFLENLNENFNVEILKNSSRNPFKHSLMDELNDDERWLLMSEGRDRNMNWLVCIPKKPIN